MEQRVISQGEQLKSFTHPLRVRLMDLLRSGAELTATQAAALTGESVAACSFHLRQLAKFGVVEPGERRGREKPWKARAVSLIFKPADGDASAIEMVGVTRALLSQSIESLDTFMQQVGDDDPEWVNRSHQYFSGFWLTKEEYTELSEEITRVLERFDNQRRDSSAPEGARFARVMTALWTETR